jgi:hypothetical protein
MRKKTKNRHGGFGLQVLMLLFLLLVGANGAYAQSDCFEYEGSGYTVITGLTDKGRAASSLTIPATVTTVNSKAFSNAANVSTLIIEAGGNPTFEGKLFGDNKSNTISDIQILGNSMTVANITALFESLTTRGALSTAYIAGYSGEWSDITNNAVLTSGVTVTLPAALVSTQQFGNAKVCGRFEITKEIISFCGNATFQDTDDGSNMLFYIADECNKEEGYIHIKRVRYIKQGEGVLIHKMKNTSAYADLPVYDGVITGDDATLYNSNLLKGVTTATTIGKTEDDKTNLVLSNGAFHPTSGGTIGANKAYLQVPSTALAAREMLTLSFDEGATAIRLTTSPTRDEGEWYDLSGRLLNSRPSAKGLYIYNGKKYVIR